MGTIDDQFLIGDWVKLRRAGRRAHWVAGINRALDMLVFSCGDARPVDDMTKAFPNAIPCARCQAVYERASQAAADRARARRIAGAEL